MPTTAFSCRRIVVATDFSESAAAALGRAVSLAQRTNAEVTVTHVLDDVAAAVPATSFAFHWTIPPADLEKAERKLRRESDERLKEWVAPHKKEVRKLRTETRVGVPFVEIIRAALARNADLVLAGTRGRSGLERIVVGSTAERLIRKCPCPVWITKPEHEWPLRSILVPIDLTPVSAKCLSVAGTLAKAWECSVTVLFVLNFAPEESAGALTEMPSQAFGRRRREARQGAARLLSDFLAIHAPAGVEIRSHLAIGPPWRMIDRVARRMDSGLIVMGSVGRTGIPGFLIGNTAEKVVRACARSILTVKPEGFESPVRGEMG